MEPKKQRLNNALSTLAEKQAILAEAKAKLKEVMLMELVGKVTFSVLKICKRKQLTNQDIIPVNVIITWTAYQKYHYRQLR